MIVGRIPAEIYFANNPVYIELRDDAAERIVVTARNNSTLKEFELTLDLYNGMAMFDASIIAKAMMPLPLNSLVYQEQGLNYNRVNITFTYESMDSDDEIIDVQNQTLTFIRGGLVVGNNIYITDGSELIESERVPVWSGYPTGMAEVEGNQIIYRTILQDKEIEVMPTLTCNGMYLMWLNSKGGYSFWLFEIWEIELKSDKSDVLQEYRPTDNYQGFQTTGNKSTYSINVQSAIKKSYFNHIKSLVNSPEVWVFNLENFVDYYSNFNPVIPPINGIQWKRIHNNGNSFNWNSWEVRKDVSFNFDLVLTENREMLW